TNELPPVQTQSPKIAFDDNEGETYIRTSLPTEKKKSPDALFDVDRNRRASEAINQHIIQPVADNEAQSSDVEPHMALHTLYLELNEIGDEGVRHIANGLANNQALTTIDLSYSHIGQEGLEYIESARTINT
ncbi:unnamed protein product, partial [Didymodactylos carnosus]